MRLVYEDEQRESGNHNSTAVQSPVPSPNENERPKDVEIGENLKHVPFPQGVQEEPVNLSVKKVDLFNLTQLAEVSATSF